MALPYFMMSRCVNSLKDFYYIFLALLFSAVVLAYAGIIEELMHWKFYNRLPKQLDLDSFGVARYRSRSGFIRISSTASNPISFGYFIVLSIGGLLYVSYVNKIKKRIFLATSLLLGFALSFTFSRGAWLSAIALITVYLYVKKTKFIKTIMSVLGVSGIIFLLFSPVDNLKNIDEHGTFEYRKELIKHSYDVIKNNIMFGSNDFTNNDTMEEMRQGEGIIDVVNTYLQIILQSGVIGLSTFIFIFIFVLKRILNLIKKFRKKGEKEAELLGCIIFSMILATMVMIGTTSSIDIIPIYYWILLGIGSAYIRVSRP
jgi:O-antigen ligase